VSAKDSEITPVYLLALVREIDRRLWILTLVNVAGFCILGAEKVAAWLL
jgi:hypothetical protein